MDDDTREAWETYFNYIYDNSPVFQEHLETYGAWYGPQLRDYFAKRANRRDACARQAG